MENGLLTAHQPETASNKEYLYLRLADDILVYIDEKQIKDGERIPSERALAEMFHTSRTSVREAVRILENKGILDIQIGNGMYLKSVLPEETYRIELWKINYAEFLEIKKVLELHIIEELCGYVPAASIGSIEEALHALEQGYAEGNYNHAADVLFHRRLRGCSRNFTMIQLLENLTMKLDEYGLRVKEMANRWYETVPYHRELWDAILAHDYAKAQAAYQAIYDLDHKALRGDY